MIYNKYESNDKCEIFLHIKVKESIIEEKIYNLCNNILKNSNLYSINNKDKSELLVDYIKTIFREYNIENIVIHLNSKNEYTKLKIENNVITSYTRTQKKEYGEIQFKYGEDGINLYCNNNDLNEINKQEEFNNFYNKSLNNVLNINKSKKIELMLEEKVLVTTYKAFFNKYPDLSNIEDYSKVQSMMWLVIRKCPLYHDYRAFFGDYTIRYNHKPTSYKLKNLTDRIVPYGQTNEEQELEKQKRTYIIQNVEYIKLIKNMGKIVNDYINRYSNSQEILDNIAKVSYTIDRLVPKYYEIEDILHVNNDLNYEQVEEIITFLTNLDISLQSEKPYEIYKELEKENKSKIKINRK